MCLSAWLLGQCESDQSSFKESSLFVVVIFCVVDEDTRRASSWELWGGENLSKQTKKPTKWKKNPRNQKKRREERERKRTKFYYILMLIRTPKKFSCLWASESDVPSSIFKILTNTKWTVRCFTTHLKSPQMEIHIFFNN